MNSSTTESPASRRENGEDHVWDEPEPWQSSSLVFKEIVKQQEYLKPLKFTRQISYALLTVDHFTVSESLQVVWGDYKQHMLGFSEV